MSTGSEPDWPQFGGQNARSTRPELMRRWSAENCRAAIFAANDVLGGQECPPYKKRGVENRLGSITLRAPYGKDSLD